MQDKGRCYLFLGRKFFGRDEYDEYSAAEALAALKAALGPADALSTNTTVLDGAQASLSQLHMLCNTAPFLADHRLVIVEGLPGHADRPEGRRDRGAGGGARGLGEWETLPALIAALPPSTTLVIMAGPVAAGNALVQALRPVAEVRDFPALRGPPLEQWVRTKVAAAGGQITRDAVRLLVEFCGSDLRALSQDIRKLITYAGARPIEEEDVRQLVSQAREAKIFDLIDAVIARHRPEAIRALEQLLQQNEPAPVIIGMLARQLRMMVQAKEPGLERATPAQMAAALGTPSEFVVRKTLEQARGYSLPALKALYRRLLETDVAIKTGAVEGELGLEMLVAHVAGRTS